MDGVILHLNFNIYSLFVVRHAKVISSPTVIRYTLASGKNHYVSLASSIAICISSSHARGYTYKILELVYMQTIFIFSHEWIQSAIYGTELQNVNYLLT